MSEEKRIEEMIKHCPYYIGEKCCIDNELPERCDMICQFGTYAEALYNAGYRKQEWISVDERLPEPQKLVLCIWERCDERTYGFARYQREDVWYVSNEGMPRVTHWMPLPEARR